MAGLRSKLKSLFKPKTEQLREAGNYAPTTKVFGGPKAKKKRTKKKTRKMSGSLAKPTELQVQPPGKAKRRQRLAYYPSSNIKAVEPIRSERRHKDRNKPCPCGCGLKKKKCKSV